MWPGKTKYISGNRQHYGFRCVHAARKSGRVWLDIFDWLADYNCWSEQWLLPFSRLIFLDLAPCGLHAFSRKAFGNYMDYQANLVYRVANIVGNVCIAVAGLGYLTHFLPWLNDPWLSAFTQICFVWLFAYVNICGPKLVASIQVVATSIKLVPILGVTLLGWFWFSPEIFAKSLNVSGKDEQRPDRPY